MGRIQSCFEALAANNKKALVPYVVAGDPLIEATLPTMHALVAAGADIIELGVPFSDPMAEGPVIQLGHERALANKVSLRTTLDMVAEFRQTNQHTPVLLMGYANPIERMGYAEFVTEAARVGLDAVLTVDMPPEEVEEFNGHLAGAGLDNIFLVAPTTPAQRIEKIAEMATGFVYYVSLKGVTGAGHLDLASVVERLTEIRRCCSLPVAVGFGVKDAAAAATLGQVADGVVVGSALVQEMADRVAAGDDTAAVAAAVAGKISDMRAAMDGAMNTVQSQITGA